MRSLGTSYHHELELLNDVGMSTVDVLRSATILPAQAFNLFDRGILIPGRRADLVLLTANPLEDIKNSKSIAAVWAAGVYCPTVTDLWEK